MDKFIKILTFVFSLAAIGFSVYAVSNQCSPNIPTTVLSLVAICATLIVGISVVDTFAVHSALRRMEDKMSEQAQRMIALDDLEKEMHKVKRQSNILFHHTWGLICSRNQPFAALAEFWKALELAAKDDDISRAKTCLVNTEEVVEDIIQGKTEHRELDESDRIIIPRKIPADIKESKVYDAFGVKIEDLIKRINKL